MKKGILEYKSVWSPIGDYNWKFRPVLIIGEGKNTYRIWSWREPLTRVVHKKETSEKVKPR
jgi:hypothetical protein